ncbi:diguanylate cyclase [Pseudodesulfovibrio sp.]|uniref:diguanylate cyclase n=1 Tax=Pseudodesulfovibrio sp. TaxID=2035812 RepID=UPI00260DF95A|nr:diguanylate cyclase [Pseudodesulfovibrio sp.]MDD3311730.1 diguanylate cyclase [Pseudodesulfovibrio sp.]
MVGRRPASRIVEHPRIWLHFTLQVSLVVVIFVAGLYLGVFMRDRNLIKDQILVNARSHFQSIVLTRLWSAGYGGVYVEKKKGVESNPYLKDPEVVARDGRVFTLRNPAMMTREVSELAAADGAFLFHITSLRPVNPGNAPDEFETAALKSFELGAPEAWGEETRGDATLFRYMAPLVVEPACLHCHSERENRVGDIRGGISVTLDISDVKAAMGTSHAVILGLVAFSTAGVIGVFLLFVLRLMRRLTAADAKIAMLAVTDELTGLANRRAFFERFEEEADRAGRYGTPLSLVMFDIDHFKAVNDTFGHPMGDTVLTEVARLLSANARTSDILARYGGEEFAMLIPAMSCEEAARAAEKLRTVIEVNDPVLEGPRVKVTISAGVADAASVRSEGGSLRDNLLKAADRALYRAKAEGRNRVVTHRRGMDAQLDLE